MTPTKSPPLSAGVFADRSYLYVRWSVIWALRAGSALPLLRYDEYLLGWYPSQVVITYPLPPDSPFSLPFPFLSIFCSVSRLSIYNLQVFVFAGLPSPLLSLYQDLSSSNSEHSNHLPPSKPGLEPNSP